MSKQLALMIVLTVFGTLGVYVINPMLGVIVYYVLALLRPPELWEWVLPKGIYWSYYVGLATLLAGFLSAIGGMPDNRPLAPRRPMFGRGHWMMLLFGAWIAVTYFLALNRDAAEKWSMDYLKIVLMFAASAVIIRTINEVRTLLVCAAITLWYLAVEINVDYLKTGYMRVYFNGHGGLDNNGAGLLIAMSIPLFYFLFESLQSRWRWLFLLVIPAGIHAVQMTFSRGAMLSLVAIVPLVVLRSRYRKRLLVALVTLGPPLIYLTAGKEIQARFFSIETAREMDGSAQSRLQSWTAALRIASDYPVFGVGVRNSNLLALEYGMDMEGRTIHSTYLQLAADNGFVGLGIYLLLLLTVWRELRCVRRETRGRDDPESRLYHGMASGIETSMALCCFGQLFLSLEVLDLPYLLMLCGSQMALIYAHRHALRYDPLSFTLAKPLAASHGD